MAQGTFTDHLSGVYGVWQTWPTTISNLTLGNGTLRSYYTQIGKTVFFRFYFKLGTTSAVGTNPSFTLPVVSHSDYGLQDFYVAYGMLFDAGTAQYSADLDFLTTKDIPRFVNGGTSGAAAAVTATAPFTWTTNDILSAHGFYEAA